MAKEKENELMEKVVSLCKRRGFIFQGSEIYGGLAGTFDYGDLGGELLHNIKNSWWKKFVSSRRDMYGIRAAILMNSKVWEASGHVAGFADPMVECEKCKNVFRADSLVENIDDFNNIKNLFNSVVTKILNESDGQLTEVKQLILSAKTLESQNLSDEEKESLKEALDPIWKDIGQKISKIEDKHQLAKFIVNGLRDSSKYNGFVTRFYLNKNILCPKCKEYKSWSIPRQFNMMFKTQIGAMEDSSSTVYLRPETAQGIFSNFKNTVDAYHPKLPFGMAQIGKAFRNEITPRDFIFRCREFEQMEIEYFVREADWEKEFESFKGQMNKWMEDIGIDMSKVHELEVAPEDLAHYSKRTVDFEFDYPFGKKELFGLAYRGNFDLTNHKLEYVDEEAGEKITPHVIEPSFGVDRAFLALFLSAYTEDNSGEETRVFLKFKPKMAPILACVSPLLKNKPELVEYAEMKVFAPLKAEFGRIAYDDNGNIGKRYRRQDEIGTPWCIVIDFDTLTDDSVTIRDRDTGTQERVKVSDLSKFIKERLD